MGDVVAVLKVMPQSPDVDLEALRGEVEGRLPDGTDLQGVEDEDVAFGLTALNVTVTLSDAEGGAEPVRESFEGIDGVESVQVTDVARM